MEAEGNATRDRGQGELGHAPAQAHRNGPVLRRLAMDSLDPRRVLQRGYAIIRGPDDVPITRAEGLVPGMAFQVEFAGRELRDAVAVEALDLGTAPAKAPKLKRAKAKSGAESQGTLF